MVEMLGPSGFFRQHLATRSARRVTVLLLALTAVGACFYLFFHTAEPRYRGRTVGQWLSAYHYENGKLIYKPIPGYDEAIRALGTNAIPSLVRMLSAKDPLFYQPIVQFFGDVQHPVVNWLRLNKAWLGRRDAAVGFGVLGPTATNVIPALLKTKPTGELVDSLNAMGPDGLPLVLRTIEAGNDAIRFTGLFALQAKAYDRKTVVETWLHYANDPSPKVRWAAVTLLWAAPLQERPEVLPKLQELQHDPDRKVAEMASLTLNRVTNSTTEFSAILVPP